MSANKTLVVGDLRVSNPGGMMEYARRVGPMFAQFGGTSRISVGKIRRIEGLWKPHLLTVQEWPSEAAFEAFYQSEIYQKIKGLRLAASETSLVLMETMDLAAMPDSEIT